MAVWALTSGELRHPVGQAFIFGGRGENWRLGLGEAGGFKYFFPSPAPSPVSPERYSYGSSDSSSRRMEGSCRRRRQSSSSSNAEQGQWETGVCPSLALLNSHEPTSS